jgi:DNA-directed RNA polymerase subunit RPC12/RpoP
MATKAKAVWTIFICRPCGVEVSSRGKQKRERCPHCGAMLLPLRTVRR